MTNQISKSPKRVVTPKRGVPKKVTPRVKQTPRVQIRQSPTPEVKRAPARKPPASSPTPRHITEDKQPKIKERLTSRRQNPYRPVPAAPNRQGAGIILPTAATATTAVVAAQQQQKNRMRTIQHRFSSLEAQAQLSNVYQTIGHLDSRLTAFPLELDELRDRGYVHAGQLEDRIATLDEKWDEIRPRVEETLKQQVQLLNGDMDQTRRLVSQMSQNDRSISAAENAVQGLSQKISAAERAVTGLYGGLDAQIHEIDRALDDVDWMLDQFEAADLELREAEGPLAAAKTEWHRDGDEGPRGLLLLTDQRLFFEQREEVATKKILGLFTTESAKIQELLLEIEVKDIERIEDLEERNGFLNLSKDEILETTLSPNAPVSRARFHLLDEDSTEWAALIKRIKSGGIDEDRAEEYLTEVEDARVVASTFPERCPYCFATLEQPPRGVTSVNCEFCSSVINAKSEKNG